MHLARAFGMLALAACSAPAPLAPSPPAASSGSAATPTTAASVALPVAPSATALAATSAKPSAPAPMPRALISGARFDNPTPMVVDETNVYVSSGGVLLVVPKDGSAPPANVFPTPQIVSALTADATDVWVGIYPADGPEPKGAIVRIDKKTRKATEVARTTMLTSIAVDDDHVWFGLLSDGAYRIDKKGSKPKAVFTGRGQVGAIAEDDENVYFGVTRYGPRQRAEIDVVKKRGGAFSVFTTDAYDLMGLLALPDAIVANDNGVVKRFPRSGGPPEKLSAAGSVVGLARRGVDVFFCDILLADTSRSAGVFAAGKAPRLLSEAPGSVGLALDDRAVYWADATSRQVMALDLEPSP